MRKLLIATAVVAAVLIGWRWTLTTTADTYRDRIVLRWVTDINPTRNEQVAEFERLNPDIHIVIDPSAKGKELIQLSGGKGPDLIDLGTDTFTHYARNGVLYDFTELREADNRRTLARNREIFAANREFLADQADVPAPLIREPPLSADNAVGVYAYNRAVLAWNRDHSPRLTLMDYPMTPDIFWDALRTRLVYDGRLLASPANASSSIIIYNRDVFDRYDVAYPEAGWTTDEFLDKALALSHKAPGSDAYESFGMLPVWVPECWVQLGGGRFFNEAGTECILTESGGQEALAWLGQLWVDNERGVHAALTSGDSVAGASGRASVWESFGRGNVAMLNAGRWVFSLTGPLLNYGYVPMPRFPDVPEDEVGIYFGGRTTGITRDCTHPEAAYKFLKYLTGREYGRVLVNSGDGFSGVRYYRDEPWALFDPTFPEVQSRMLQRFMAREARDRESLQALSTAELQTLAAAEWERLGPDERAAVQAAVEDEMRMMYEETSRGVNDEVNPYISQATMKLTLRTITERVQSGSLSPEEWAPALQAAFNLQLHRVLKSDRNSLKYTVGNIAGAALLVLIAVVGLLAFRRHRAHRQPRLPGSREEKIAAACFLAPNLTGFLIFTFIPVIFSFMIAFTNFNTLTNEITFVGFRNFVDQLSRREFWYFLFNTVVFMIGLPISVALSLALAVLLNNRLRGYIAYRTVFYLPSIVSGVAIFMLWAWMYDPEYGLINGTLRALGLDNPPNWLNGGSEFLGIRFFWAKPALIAMSVWMAMGGPNVLLFLAGLSAISPHLYEAAEIDGASRWRQFWHITWPLLTPTTFFIMIMGVIQGLQGGFEMAYTMTQGGPQQSTTTLGYHIYNTAFFEFEMGQAAAVAWFLFLLLFGVTLMNWKFGEKRVNY